MEPQEPVQFTSQEIGQATAAFIFATLFEHDAMLAATTVATR